MKTLLKFLFQTEAYIADLTASLEAQAEKIREDNRRDALALELSRATFAAHQARLPAKYRSR